MASHKWLNIAGRKSGDFESTLLEGIGIWEANFGIGGESVPVCTQNTNILKIYPTSLNIFVALS